MGLPSECFFISTSKCYLFGKTYSHESCLREFARFAIKLTLAFSVSPKSLDEATLPRSGRKGWLLKTDVLDYVHRHKLVPQPQEVPLPAMLLSSPPAAAVPPRDGAKSAASAKAAAAIGSVATPYQDLELTSMRKTIAKRLTEVREVEPPWSGDWCALETVSSCRHSL